MQLLEGRIQNELLKLTRERAPHEAVGLILSNGQVVELLNHSGSPENHFEVHRDDILKALADEVDPSVVTFWHSHPSGGVGPSRTDMKHKTPFASHLVVSLINNNIVASWY